MFFASPGALQFSQETINAISAIGYFHFFLKRESIDAKKNSSSPKIQKAG
jgi:hypothetical protein